jgi:hypothetical protein
MPFRFPRPYLSVKFRIAGTLLGAGEELKVRDRDIIPECLALLVMIVYPVT